jgi:ferredoxin
MIKLTIDKRVVQVEDGATVLDAADKLGIDIPTMCFLKGINCSTSCMVCVVRINGSDDLMPACGTIAKDGMIVETDCSQVIEARQAALELLLSDHVGDCAGPCTMACPANMDIPLMIRQIRDGQLTDAIKTIKNDIALPAVLGRICPAPCEKICRRKDHDEAVSICHLKRYAADIDLASADPFTPDRAESKSKQVAIVGAGPAGLSAAYYLSRDGYECTIFDEHELMGGTLRYSIPENDLDRKVLDAEIAQIKKLSVTFKGNTKIGKDISIDELAEDFGAVFIATGKTEDQSQSFPGIEIGPKGIIADHINYRTSKDGIFAGGGAIGRSKMAIRALADGKQAAVSIDQYLASSKVTGPGKLFNSRMARLYDGEVEHFFNENTNKCDREDLSESQLDGDAAAGKVAAHEAARCLHCDCRKAANCKLRDLSSDYSARASRYDAPRREFTQQRSETGIIFEQGKCIDCGICIEIAKQHSEEFGLTFAGRGFDVRVKVPFGRSISEGLKKTAEKCATACPTGAISYLSGQ